MNNEQLILCKATLALQNITGLPVQCTATAKEQLPSGLLPIKTVIGSITLPTLVKHRLTAPLISYLTHTKDVEGDLLFVAEGMSTELKKILRQLKLNYLDTAGNCYIQVGCHFIDIEGRKAVATPVTPKHPLNKSGLRLLFALLTKPDAINATVRELAAQTDLSVGTVQKSLDNFKDLGYIGPAPGKRRKLLQVDRLQERWVNLYENILKPGLLINRFRLPSSMQPSDWRKIELEKGSYWSGEPAANALIDNPWPYQLTIYTSEKQANLLHYYHHLTPDPKGQVEMNRVFWHPDKTGNLAIPTAPPLLVYADLLATPDPRNLKVARTIYQQFLQQQP